VKLLTIMGVVGRGLALAIAPAGPALAAVPQRGTVVEGRSIPGVALGATRQRVVATYGTPAFCLSTGQAVCTWQRDQGAVGIGFAGANGGNPATRHLIGKLRVCRTVVGSAWVSRDVVCRGLLVLGRQNGCLRSGIWARVRAAARVILTPTDPDHIVGTG
jgi:hypothetical protein